MPAKRKGKGLLDFAKKAIRSGAHWGVDQIANHVLGSGLKRKRVRKSGSGLVKGSAEAKRVMARVRACKRKKRGGSFLAA
jgi:hypothetical protein